MKQFNIGDKVQWYDPEDGRVYHGFEITKLFSNSGEVEISSDDDGTFTVYSDDLEYEQGENFVEDIDIGWDMEARRDDAISKSRMRDSEEKKDKSTQITLNDRKTSLSYAKFLVKKLLSDNECIKDSANDLLHDLDSARDGDEFDVHEIESYLHQNFVPKYAEVVKESRLPHKWAIDFRNMHTAIHGLFYGDSRKEVESFYNNLVELNTEDMDGYDIPDLLNAFDSIKIIDEINFREIRKLPSGRYGIEIDDVEYWIINNVSEDLYMESTNMKNKWKKIMKESEDNGVTPKVYVGTYAKYNDGSLGGEWVDLTDFDTYEDFVDYCKELHKDENDPEFMIQDKEGYPDSWYHESGLPTEDEFYKIQELSELDETEKKAYAAFCELGWGDDSIEKFREAYHGEYTSDDDFGQEIVDNMGMPQNPDLYFDFESFGRDLMYDYHIGDEDNEDAEGNPEDPNHYYDNEGYDQGEYESDYQVAEDFIDGVYGSVEKMDKETLERYFDFASFGRDLLINDFTEYDGYIFWNS